MISWAAAFGICIFAAQDKEFTITARAVDGSIHCEGTCAQPDGARLTIWVYRRRVKTGVHLAKQAAFIKDGKFSVQLPVFHRRFVPGPYVVLATYYPSLQRVAGWDDRRKVKALVEVKGDPKQARAEYVEELIEAINAMDRIRREMPVDWKKRAKAIELKYGSRLENRIHGLGDLTERGFSPMIGCLGEIADATSKQRRQRLNRWFGAYARSLEARLGPTIGTYQRACDLVAELEEAVRGGRLITSELLELSPLLSRAAHGTLVDLARASREGDKPEAIRFVRMLTRYIPAPESPRPKQKP